MFWKPKNPFTTVLLALEQWKIPCMVSTQYVALEEVTVDFVGNDIVEFINEDVDPDEGTIFTVRTVVKLSDIVCVSYDYGATNIDHVLEEV